MSSSFDPRSVLANGPCRELEWSGSDPSWSAPLEDGRSIRLGSMKGRIEISTELPESMRGLRPEELLAWQFGSPTAVCADQSGGLRLRAGVPADGLAASGVTSLAEAMISAPDHPTGCPRDSAATAKAISRSIWETEYGQSAIRETAEGLELAKALAHTTAPLALRIDSASRGPRMTGLVVAADFVEPDCREALAGHLLFLNAHTVVGGFALDQEGSVVFSVVVPGDPKRSQISHALKSIVACCRRFAGQISRLATEPEIAELWTRLNEPSDANQGTTGT